MIEICFHGRGGQGAVMASEVLVRAMVFEGNYGQSIPAYGFERRGAPLQAFVKMDNRPIRERVQVTEPHGLIVLDESLISQIPVFQGMRPDGFAIMNVRQKMTLEQVPETVAILATIDANRIALDIFNAPITNTIMLGAFGAATGYVKLDSLKESIATYFPERIVEKNLKAVERGFNEVSLAKREIHHGKGEVAAQ